MPIDPPSAAANPLSPAARARVARWMDALLDLSRRNPLVAFRREGRRVLPIVTDDVSLLEDALAEGLSPTLVPASPEGGRDKRKGSTLAVALPPEQVYARAVELDREARKGADEGGAWNLYMAVGLLAWKGRADATLTESPVLLVPVALQIDRTKREARLVRHDDETLVNPALLELMRREFGIALDGLEDLPEDDLGVDVDRVFASVREAIARFPEWSVREEAFVARFAFDKIVMWKDLRDHGEALVGTGLAARLADPNAPLPASALRERAREPRDLDAHVPTASLPLVVDADSSQLAAIELAQRGGSFVLEGPPGTGKSQTITNIVATLLAKGKRVLFVSEKMAALRVVHHRLALVGLDAACLELHAHAAVQSAALRRGLLVSLDEGWNVLERAPGDEANAAWTVHARTVDEARADLNGYVRALHAPLAVGMCFRDALARRVKWRRRRLPLPLQLPPAIVRGATEAHLASVRAEIERFSYASSRVAPMADHALAGCGIATVDGTTIARLMEAEVELREGAAAWEAAWAGVARVLGDPAVPRTEARLERLTLLEALAREVPPVSVRDAARWPALRTAIAESERTFGEAEAAHRALMERWSEEIYAHLDLAPKARHWATAFVLFAWFALWAVRRTLAPVARGALPDRARVAEDLEAAIAQRGLLEAARAGWSRIVAAYAPRVTEREALRAGLERAEQLRVRCAEEGEAFARIADGLLDAEADAPVRTEILEILSRSREALRAVEVATDTLEATLRVPVAATRAALGDRWLAEVPARVARWSRIDESAREWAAYRASVRALEALGLSSIVRDAEDGRLDLRALPETFEDALADLAAATAMAEDPTLGAFDGDRHGAKISEFRASERESFVRARSAVLAVLKARAPRRGHAASAASELGVLERELRKKTRHMPVRKLLRELPTLLPRLKPCLLMSPLSVAEYLPPKPGLFDCVVFDEASQITVPDAIGAIARASQVIVVGDTKQMPPSSFFRKLGEASEAEESVDDETPADLESILDEVAVVGVPRIGLRWHYRSRHEALIAFSNAKYYGSSLETFPSAAMPSEELGVRRTFLADAVYTGAGRNETEARALVASLLERLRSTAPGTRSFGVVTFGLAQQALVDDLLDEARGQEPAVEAHFADALPEPVFVKNLENVQGDERDEILFSTTYGPDERRVTRQNFGPLSRSGGARRLNVAITRARRKLHVFTSLRAADVVVTDAKSDGVRDLEAFLRYLERGAVLEATGASVGDAFDSDFEREVYDELRALGHEVHTQVGVGAYRIDLGVVDPRVPGRYLLGVECDGAAYHSGATARDRDRLREEVLTGLGWRLFRVWSTDWWTRKAAVVQRLRAALEEASRLVEVPTGTVPTLSPPPKSPAPPPATAAPSLAASTSVARAAAGASPGASAPRPAFVAEGPFEGWIVGARRVHRLRFAPRFNERLIRTPEDFFDDRLGGLFLGGLEAMVQRHGPLAREDAARLVLEASGFKRMSPKWTARVDVLVAASGALSTREGFVWAAPYAHAEHAWVRLRPDGEARDLDAVPREELATAALVVLAVQGAMPLEDLEEEISKLFGHARPRSETRARAHVGIELASKRALLELDGRRAMLASVATAEAP